MSDQGVNGVVKFFDTKKGFGFINRADGGADTFVHYSAIQMQGHKDLKEGDSVVFDVIQGERGPKAINVVKVS